jgi:D-alanyl-D-alanine carboxypeptidase
MRVNVGLLIVRGLVASVVLAPLFAASSAAAPASEDSLAPKLRKDVKDLVAAGVPGVVVLVRRDGRTVQLAGGYSNLEKKTPMRVGDRFRIGSVTKSFVATVVLQLVGEGKLSLDDSIEHWLPGLVPNGGMITVRQLLSHQSGLFDYLNDERVLKPYLSGNFGYVWTPPKLVAVSTSHPALFAPGAKFSYSNTNYIVLGLIVEAATKDTIKAQLRKRIFGPLGLRSTLLATSQRIAGAHARGYLVQGKKLQDVTLVSPSYAWTAGAMVSTASDIARFYRALLGGQLLPPDLLQAMKTTTDRVGLGLFQTPSLCGRPDLWGHDGALAAYLTLAFNSEDGKRQFVILVNSLTFNDQVGSKRAQQALGRLFKTADCGA